MTTMGGRDGGRLVWSSDGGSPCPECGCEQDACVCGSAPLAAPCAGRVRVWREFKGRRGKTVTVVRGLALDAAELNELARELKRKCGTGGSVKNGAIEIQGDQRDKVVALLRECGHDARPAGG